MVTTNLVVHWSAKENPQAIHVVASSADFVEHTGQSFPPSFASSECFSSDGSSTVSASTDSVESFHALAASSSSAFFR